MNPTLARRALIGAELLWTVSLFAVVLAVRHASSSALLQLFGTIEYAVGGLICHQQPARSFHLAGVQLPVCARCTGIYAGAALAAAAIRRPRAGRPGRFPAIAFLPVLASLAYEWGTGHTPSNALRAATGVVAGAAVMVVLLGELRSE
jgi:uncharacterized membrane protein